MKKSIFIILFITGCAHYGTNQVDEKLDPVTGKVIARTITKVGITTFANAKSDLAKSAVSQTDKTQSSKVGALNQEATNTLIKDITGLVEAVGALKK